MQPWILVIDDDPLIRMMLEDILQGPSFAIKAVDGVPAALEETKTSAPSLIISDLILPGFENSGSSVQEFRKLPHLAKVPMILLTGLSSSRVEAVEAQPDPLLKVVKKPIDWDALKQLISEMTGVPMPNE